jgi:RNA polymerase sigma factor (sigma-70 family)
MRQGQLEAVLDAPQGLPDGGRAAGLSDGQLLARFIACRDELAEIAFAALVRRHGPMVLRVCRQILGEWHTAEDAFQATFLILARRARSIRRPELLGNWLHGVALRTARELRVRDLRRRRRELPGPEALPPGPIGKEDAPEQPLVSREQVEVLYEELSRLPERYRVPVVLCELEGLTYHEAALRLRCPVGTIGVRLSRAREQLRARLTRRGLAPVTALLAALFGAEATSAWVPSVLCDATVRAAIGFAASRAAAGGLVAPGVIALTEAVLRSMAYSPLKVATGLALAALFTATVARSGTRPETAFPAAPAHITIQPDRRLPSPDEPAAAPLAARPMASLTSATPPSSMPGRMGAFGAVNWNRISEAIRDFFGHALQSALVARADRVVRAAREDVARGAMLFARDWVPNDPRAHGGDGLGPVYNETSCLACHGQGAPGGAGPDGKNVILVTATPTNGQRADESRRARIHPGFANGRSTVLHRYGTDLGYASWRRRFYNSRQGERTEPGRDPVGRQIHAVLSQTSRERGLAGGAQSLPAIDGFALTLSQRNAPALFGAGQLDAIPRKALAAVAAQQPAEIRGRVSRTRDGRVGRFGWKGQVATLQEFVRGACATELGLEVPGHSQAASPLAPSAKAKGLDMTEKELDELVAYIRALPVPVALDPSGPHGTSEMREGRRLFADIGCADCHTPTLANVRGIYSDLLLHDMGESLSDIGSSYGIEGPDSPGGPSPREWRTPPLWGFRDSGPYLHDGRAQDLEETVALHGGQGQISARRFFALSREDRFRIEAFLNSLVAPSSRNVIGVLLASAMESRVERAEEATPESLVRRRWDEARARGEAERQAEDQRRRAALAASHAEARFAIARSLEKAGKLRGALEFYGKVAHDAPETEHGRRAVTRAVAIRARLDLLDELSSGSE